MTTPELSIVIPAYNSADALPELCRRLRAVLDHRPSDSYEIIVVDDRSLDDSWAVISSLAAEHTQVVGYRLRRNSGQHLATLAGLARARGSVLVTMDDDLQHRPEDLPSALAALAPGAVVFASPVTRTHVRWRRIASALWNLPASVVLAKPVRLRLVAFRVFDRTVCERLLRTPAWRPMVSTMLLRAADEIRAVPTTAGDAAMPSRYSTGDLLHIATAYSSGVSVARLRTLGAVAVALGLGGVRRRHLGGRVLVGAGATTVVTSQALARSRRRGSPVPLPAVDESTHLLTGAWPGE